MIPTMSMPSRRPHSWLLVALTAVMGCCDALGHDASGARRLELADQVHDGVVPLTITADRSNWRTERGGDGQAAAFDVATSHIVRWGRCPPWPAGPIVLLADGGTIAGRIESADERTVVVASPTLGRIAVPAAAVRGYRASPAIGPASLATTPARHERMQLLLLANDDRVAAHHLEWLHDAVTVDVGPPQASAEAARATVSMPADVVRAIDFCRPATAASGPRILVATMDGSRIAIGALESASSTDGMRRVRLAVRLPGGDVVAECDADDIVALVVDGGRATFLAGREPASYEQTAAFGPAWPLARGHAVTGDWPAVRGTTAFTALGIHAPARVGYLLDEPVMRFESLVAIDDSAGEGGSAIVRLLAGGGGAGTREVFCSRPLRGGEEPLRIRVDFAAATELVLVVESADAGDVLDRTLWLDPVAVRRTAAGADAAE